MLHFTILDQYYIYTVHVEDQGVIKINYQVIFFPLFKNFYFIILVMSDAQCLLSQRRENIVGISV